MSESQTLDTSELASQISKGIAEGIAESRPKKLSFGQYTKREALRNPKPKFKPQHTFAQNGFPMRHETLTAEEIALLNRITRGGRYVNRKVEVVYKDESGDISVNFVYPNRTVDQRMDYRFNLRQIVEEQEAEVAAEEAEPVTVKKRR